jgi:hypothetical protein
MKKSIFALSCLALAVSAESSAELNRIVVSYKSEVGLINAQMANANISSIQDCFAINNQQLCIPKPQKLSVKTQSVNSHTDNLGFIAVDLPLGISADDAIAELQKSGLYKAVEKDVSISNGKPLVFSSSSYGVSTQNYPIDEPNDVSFFEQKFYFSLNAAERPVGVGILEAWAQLPSESVEPIDVIIMDGGFMTRDDLVYASGYNFSKKNAVRGPEFLTPSTDASCSGHGLGVASVVGAKINNSLNLSGMVADVNIHALKTMDCYGGYMSDAADTLLWLAGTTFPDIPAYIGKAGVVNMSLGAIVDHCPSFMQTAIDAAVAAGFSIVVSAGNENIDVSGASPANCANVIAVSALHKDGNKSDFSNYGEKVTIAAPGYDVVGLCGQSTDDICFWGGTSFSSPIVAGALAIARQQAGLKAGTEKLLLAMSVNPIPDSSGECAALGCGEGLLDVNTLVNLSKTLNIGSSASVEYTLSNESKCTQAWLATYAGIANLCTLLTFKTSEDTLLSGVTYSLQVRDKIMGGTYYEVKPLSSVSTQIAKDEIAAALASSGSSAEISQLEFQYEICKGEQCAAIPVNSEKLADSYKPACVN